MTNTKFRRRALVSSVAMLLVALIALGSATFAWFTSNPDATADGLSVKATSSKGLVIRTASAMTNTGVGDNTTWEHKDYLNCNTTRTATGATTTTGAASIDPTATAWTAFAATASQDTNYAADEFEAVTSVPEASVFHDRIWTKVTGGDATAAIKIKSVDVTLETHDLADAVRIALYYNDGSTATKVGEYASATKTDEKHLTGAIAKSETAKTAAHPEDSKGYYNATHSEVTIPAWSTISNTALGNANSTGTSYLDVYVYLDGEDSACTTSHIDVNQILSNLDINLAIA